MHATDYAAKASEFAKYSSPDYPFLALGEETGEVLGKLAKYSRKRGVGLTTAIKDTQWNGDHQADIISELGDVLWQLTACCEEIDISLNDLMHANIKKLMDRQARNVIVGEGDNR